MMKNAFIEQRTDLATKEATQTKPENPKQAMTVLPFDPINQKASFCQLMLQP